jgi:glycosyltransferase involved in cell wall biosynthesis
MKSAHYLLLPSTSSEGFPKVIAEAWYNGCVPIVSDVSCVGQYIKDGVNGFLCSDIEDNNFIDTLKRATVVDFDKFRMMQLEGYKMCNLFTYKFYKERLVKDIIREYNY